MQSKRLKFTDRFEIKGDWFLPSKKDLRTHGTLRFDPFERIHLELYGSIDNDASIIPQFKNQELILGITSESELVTLFRCNMTRSKGAPMVYGIEGGKPSTTYTVTFVFFRS